MAPVSRKTELPVFWKPKAPPELLSTPLSVAKSAPVLTFSTTLTVRCAPPKSIGLVNVTSANALVEPSRSWPPVGTKPPLPHVSPAPLLRVTVRGVVWAAKPPPPLVPPKVIVPVPLTMLPEATKSRAKVPEV